MSRGSVSGEDVSAWDVQPGATAVLRVDVLHVQRDAAGRTVRIVGAVDLHADDPVPVVQVR